jgi:hypothetical protein
MENININIVVFSCLSVIFLILNSPKWLKNAYLIWTVFLIITLQITYNELSIPKDTTTKIVIGKDEKNLQARFKIYMLNDKFSWKFKSDDTLQINGEDISPELFINSLEISEDIEKSLAVICIGNSSHEGNWLEEEKRATRRASQVATWLKEFFPENADKIHILDLGINKFANYDTSTQRRLIIISLINQDNDINIAQALKNGLSNEKILPFDIKEYSKFELK